MTDRIHLITRLLCSPFRRMRAATGIVAAMLMIAAATSASAQMAECSYSETIPEVENPENLVSFADPYLGDFNSDVIVIEFFDPNCPHCKTMHPIMQDVVAANSDQAVFYMIPFVLWQYSLPQVEALYVAAQEDRYHTMVDLQYKYQTAGGMSLEQLGDIAAEIGLEREQFMRRVRQGLNQRSILERREEIRSLGVSGTPAIMINGKFVASSSKSRRCLNELIQQEVDAAAAEKAEKVEKADSGDGSGRR